MSDRYAGFFDVDNSGAEGETLEQCAPIPWCGVGQVSEAYVKALTTRLLSASFREPELLGLFAIQKAHVSKILVMARELFSREQNIVDILVPFKGSVHVFGDTHGDIHSLVEALSIAGWPSADNILCFAGDCVDRGSWGVEVVLILLILKLWRPHCVFIIRGNHETTGCTTRYGFEAEVERKFDASMFATFGKTFRELPCAAVIRKIPKAGNDDTPPSSESGGRKAENRRTRQSVGTTSTRPARKAGKGKGKESASVARWGGELVPGERRILVVHGGLFRSWKSKKKGSTELGDLADLATVRRQFDDPCESIVEDVLWSDPQLDAPDVAANGLRGAGILYGQGAVEAFFKRNSLHGLIRAHEGPDMREKRPNMANMLSGFSLDMELVDSFVATVFTSAQYPPDNPRQNKGAFASVHGSGLERMQMIPKFTWFEKRHCPKDYTLFYSPEGVDGSATPRNSIS